MSIRRVIALFVFSASVAICFLTPASDAGMVRNRQMTQRTYARGEQVDSNDLPALEAWASQMCQGVNVFQLATALEVEPTMTAVVASLTDSYLATRCSRDSDEDMRSVAQPFS